LSHIEDLKFRMMAVEFLRAAKKRYTYRRLSFMTKLPVTVLSRYAKGHILPKIDRARELFEKLKAVVGLEVEVREGVRRSEDGFFDNTGIVGSYHVLELAAQRVLMTFAGMRVTKILTAAVDGVPLATVVANKLGVDLAIAKKEPEVGVSDFITESFVPGGSGIVMTLYLPKGLIKKRDHILIVDDMIRTGETQQALVNIVRKARAKVTGAFFLIAIGDEWMRRIDLPERCPIEIVMRVR